MQDISAELDSFWIQFAGWVTVAIEQSNPRVEVPAIVIKWTFRRQRGIESLNLFEVHLLEVHEAYNDVGNLNARIVNIVLHLHALARRFEDAHKSVTQHGIAHMSDVGGLIWVDARVFHHLLRLVAVVIG